VPSLRARTCIQGKTCAIRFVLVDGVSDRVVLRLVSETKLFSAIHSHAERKLMAVECTRKYDSKDKRSLVRWLAQSNSSRNNTVKKVFLDKILGAA
jgi:hypothetical protein